MKSLICITTCNRPAAVRAVVWDYISFCKDNIEYDFIVSLDGSDERTISYCKRHHVPIVYSKKREGVGLSKNRVLLSYPDYPYYFFIEDDVLLLNPAIFSIFKEVSERSGIPHLSLFSRDRLIKHAKTSTVGTHRILHAWFGGAPFNFFTREGLDTVGGFDLSFAELRRFGHTEHSYRFVNAGLTEYPFNVIEECMEGYVRWTEPGSVTRLRVATNLDRLYVGEAELIRKKQAWAPIATISEYVKPDSLALNSVVPPQTSWFDKALFLARVNIYDQLRAAKKKVTQIYSPASR